MKKDAILTDIRAGLPYDRIARRHQVTKYAVRKIAFNAGIKRKASPNTARRPIRPCEGCGIATSAKSGKCRTCQDATWPTDVCHEDALTEGRWVLSPARRVLVWIPSGDVA